MSADTLQLDPELYLGTSIKEAKDLTKAQLADAEFLARLIAEYDVKFHGVPEYAAKRNRLNVKYLNLKQSESEVSELSIDEKLELAVQLLPNLKKHFNAEKTATREVFLVVDEANRLGSLIKNSRSVRETIRHYIGQNIVKAKMPLLPPHEVGQLADIWFDYEPGLDFETFGGFSADKWCLGRCLYRPAEAVGPMPTWERFLGRLNDPEAFASWIYGVASKAYKGRQVLWLHGEHGEDGKTYVQKLFAKALFPNVSHAMVNSALNGDASRWMGSEFEDKTLAYWDDCNNSMALFLEVVKQLSAGSQGNKARIEGKGQAAYTGQLETRLWINSNVAPKVSQDNFITSRLVYISIDKMDEAVDPNIGEAFLAEMPQFLRFARDCYAKTCADNYRIVQTDAVLETIADFGSDFEAKNIDVFDDYFEEGQPEDYVTTKRVAEVLKLSGIVENQKIADWYVWLAKRHRGHRRQRVINGKKTKVVCGIRENKVGLNDLRLVLGRKTG